MSSGDTRGDGPKAGRPAPGESETYAQWLARMQRSRGRHAAISRNLGSWANYKLWSEKARLSFDAPGEPPEERE